MICRAIATNLNAEIFSGRDFLVAGYNKMWGREFFSVPLILGQ